MQIGHKDTHYGHFSSTAGYVSGLGDNSIGRDTIESILSSPPQKAVKDDQVIRGCFFDFLKSKTYRDISKLLKRISTTNLLGDGFTQMVHLKNYFSRKRDFSLAEQLANITETLNRYYFSNSVSALDIHELKVKSKDALLEGSERYRDDSKTLAQIHSCASSLALQAT